MTVWGPSLWSLNFLDQARPGLGWPHYDSHVGCRLYSIPQREHYFNGSQPSGDGGGETLPREVCEPHHPQSYRGKRSSHYSLRLPSSTMLAAGAYKQGPAEGAVPGSADSCGLSSSCQLQIKGGHTTCLLDWTMGNAIPHWLAVTPRKRTGVTTASSNSWRKGHCGINQRLWSESQVLISTTKTSWPTATWFLFFIRLVRLR